MTKNKGAGCFTFPAIVLTAIVGSSFIKSFLSISTFSAFLLLLFLVSFIYGRLLYKQHQTSPWKYVIYSALFTAILVGIGYVFNDITTDITTDKKDISEEIYREKILEDGDSIVLLSQHRTWKNNYGDAFEGYFSVREKDYVVSKRRYANHSNTHERFSWGDLYEHLAKTDGPKLDLILHRLLEIKTNHKLNQLEFADVVVTFIQDIPYALVFETACEAPEKYEPSIRDILVKCPDCCIGDIPFGVQNPVGFMGNLKGDCDTRTVIIYTILSHFGYDVAILNSDYYRHSILGLNVPTKGVYKLHQGKRYYVWETTSKYFTLGTLPSNFKNINHWYVMLSNTQQHAN